MASSPEAFKAAGRREVQISRGLSVTIEARDFITLFLEGIFTMPLLAAMQRLIEQAPAFLTNPERFDQTTPEDRIQLIQGLRIFACAICVEPLFVMPAPPGSPPDPDPAHVPVTTLFSSDLLLIWRHGHSLMGLRQEVPAATADRFRGAEPVAHEPAAPVGENVRSATEPVVLQPDGALLPQ